MENKTDNVHSFARLALARYIGGPPLREFEKSG